MSQIITKISSIFRTPLEKSCSHTFTTTSEGKKEPGSAYIIHRASKEDYPQVLNVMHDAFFAEEPMLASLGINNNPIMDELALKAMAEGMTLVAKTKKDGQVVGGFINTTIHQTDPVLKEKLASSVQCPKVKQHLQFEAFLMNFPDLWNRFKVQKIYEMSCLFVLKEHRRKGLSTRLMKDSKALGAYKGYKLIRCDATSAYTAKLCEKLKMQLVGEIPYRSYIGKDLKPVYNPPPPHLSVKIYVEEHPTIIKKLPVIL